MLLTIDTGNTSISLGLFDGNALVEQFRLASDKDLSQEEYEILFRSLFRDFKIDGCIIASVVNELTDRLKSTVTGVFKLKPVVLSHKINTGIKITLPNPQELGADRIANAAGACIIYQTGAITSCEAHSVLSRRSGCASQDIMHPYLPVIVVDFGTATSFDVVNAKGEFIGGIIAPGLKLQMKVLNNFTSKLPKIDVALSPAAIGNNTADAVLSGVIRGTACMIDGLVEQCETELGEKAMLVATGGYSGLIDSYLKRPFDFINPTLTLEGLRYLYNLNVSGIIAA